MVLKMKHANRQMDVMSLCLLHALFAKNIHSHTHTHTHTTKYTPKTEHPQTLNCQQESDFHKMSPTLHFNGT